MLRDGDGKAFDGFITRKLYGEDINITKEDCINHVSKRMRTALRNIVANSKGQKESISGKGKMIQEKIPKITNYYSRALKRQLQ